MRILLAAMLTLALPLASPASAQGLGDFFAGLFGGESVGSNELRATIWVDPDGCEHWVMDDGLEGFMSAHLDRDGKPVCRGSAPTNGTCKTFDNAALFKIGSAHLTKSARSELETYFRTISGKSIIVAGHTDNSGSEQANLNLSLRRALAVAKIARSAGVQAEARGYGEKTPIASNDTAEGRAQNRRVELSCL